MFEAGHQHSRLHWKYAKDLPLSLVSFNALFTRVFVNFNISDLFRYTSKE